MRLAAGMVEEAVVAEVRRILQTPEVVSQVIATLKKEQGQFRSRRHRSAAGVQRALGATVLLLSKHGSSSYSSGASP